MALIYGKQITGSIVSASIATASYALTASYATNLLAAGPTSSIQYNKANVITGSADLIYDGDYGLVINNNITASNLKVQQADIIDLLSMEKLTSLSSYIIIPSASLGNVPAQEILEYSSSEYYGIVIDGIAYNVTTDDSLIFRCSITNTNNKVGTANVEVLSSTSTSFAAQFTSIVYFRAFLQGEMISVQTTNPTQNYIRIRPMYRLLKQCII